MGMINKSDLSIEIAHKKDEANNIFEVKSNYGDIIIDSFKSLKELI